MSSTTRSPDRNVGAFFMSRYFWLLPILAALISLALYWPGLAGPFMLDDFENFAAIGRWLGGIDSWWHVITSNQSGALGRPVSMASFVLGVAALGGDASSFKLINIVIHATIGLVIYVLATQLLSRDPRVGAVHIRVLGLAVAALWLFHPLHASTALYAVQRMTQLSALFVLLSLVSYVWLRTRLDIRGGLTSGLAFLIVPSALGFAAILSKENGLLFIPLCAAIELIYFSASRRPPAARVFLWLFVAAPVALATLYVATHSYVILGGYANRDFTFTERILTQGRVLTEYIGQIVLPQSNSFGLYHDDLPLSTGLFQPLSTIFALAFLFGLMLAAWMLRKRLPSFSAGVAVFFIGHGMESTVIALEIFFEHRNYLPSAGIILALVYLAYIGFQNSGRSLARVRPIMIAGCAGYALLLAVQTHARAMVWSSQEALYRQSLQAHPTSMRTRLDFSTYLVRQGLHDRAIPILEPMLQFSDPVARRLGAFQILMLRCSLYNEGSSEQLAELAQNAPQRLTIGDITSIEALAGRVEGETCRRYTMQDVADLARAYLHASLDEEHATMRWQLRWALANIEYKIGNVDEARRQSESAWATGAASAPVGGFAAELNAIQGKPAQAQTLLDQVRGRVEKSDIDGQANLERIQAMIDQSKDLPR